MLFSLRQAGAILPCSRMEGRLKSGSHPLPDKAGINRMRAEKCRDLARMIKNQKAIAILLDYAQELEARAGELESQALEPSARRA